MTKQNRICITPKVSGVGGMVSFRHKFTEGLIKRGYEVTNDLEDTPYDAVLVIGGTRNLPGLWKVKRNGVRIVQRLNGMNWLHRIRQTGLKHRLRAESANWILKTIRRNLTDAIIYQSDFAKQWWNREYGFLEKESAVVHNAVDLDVYSDQGPADLPNQPYIVLLVEGSLGGGYEVGLFTAIELVKKLRDEHKLNVELMVVGKVSEALKNQTNKDTPFNIHWKGLVPRDVIPQIDRSAHLLYSADINAACPNSVIEAMACGLPVLGFDTGAVPELVLNGAGAVVPYGADEWQLEPPDVDGLVDGAAEILKNNPGFRLNARKNAVENFSLDLMVEKYLQVLVPEE